MCMGEGWRRKKGRDTPSGALRDGVHLTGCVMLRMHDQHERGGGGDRVRRGVVACTSRVASCFTCMRGRWGEGKEGKMGEVHVGEGSRDAHDWCHAAHM